MAEFAIFILVVAGLSFLGILILAGYLGITALRLMGRIVGGIWRFVFGRSARRRQIVVRTCPRPACGEENPAAARFCRRCGRAIVAEGFTTAMASPPPHGHRVPPPIPGRG